GACPGELGKGYARPMEVLRTNVTPKSEAYQGNRTAFLEQLAYLDEQLALTRAGGGPKYVERHRQRGKLMARERIELLLDPDSPFLEIAPLAAWGTEFGIGGSIVSGVGVVSGVEGVITAREPTRRGGARASARAWGGAPPTPQGVGRGGRRRESGENTRPRITTPPGGGGAALPYQSEPFVPGGRGSRELPRRSAERIPTICLVFGS